MINIPPVKQSTPIKAEVLPDIIRAWKVGQVLNATTQQGGEALSKVLIRIGQLTIEAKTPIPLQNGQNVKLLVKSLGAQASQQPGKLPLLSIIDTLSLTAQPEKLAASKLRQFIAIQQSFSLTQQLSEKLINNIKMADKLPASLKNLLEIFQQSSVITGKNITSTQLKQQILNSGVFLEAKLNNSLQQTIANKSAENSSEKLSDKLINDFKYQLLSIRAELGSLISTKNSIQQPALSNQQLSDLQVLIKLSAANLAPGRINAGEITELADRLITLLPKISLTQLSTLLSGLKPETPAANELQLLAKFIITNLQQHGSQQLQEQLSYRLMLLDLNQQIDQSISKLTSLQLQPMIREGDNLVLLLFNLIFKDSNERFDIEFRMQQESEQDEQSDESWLVTLSFNFKSMGKVISRIHLSGDLVSTVFHTENSSTARKIKQFLPLLESGLTKAGLNIVNLGIEATLPENKTFAGEQASILDEEA